MQHRMAGFNPAAKPVPILSCKPSRVFDTAPSTRPNRASEGAGDYRHFELERPPGRLHRIGGPLDLDRLIGVICRSADVEVRDPLELRAAQHGGKTRHLA